MRTAEVHLIILWQIGLLFFMDILLCMENIIPKIYLVPVHYLQNDYNCDTLL